MRSQSKDNKKAPNHLKKTGGKSNKKGAGRECRKNKIYRSVDNSQGARFFRSMPKKTSGILENNSNNNNEIKESVRRSLREK
uniref:hypothetical protein n=1 Tax=Salmonella sp. TaxID=599 RepID=UPI001CD93A8C|nr:hypothetical protein [Salmonella sp.]